MGIKIKNVEIAFPQKTVDNDYYIKLFDKQGKDIRRLLEFYGRKERKIGDEGTSTISLGAQAAMNVLKAANLKGEDIDIIAFSSQFPEYTCPSQALIIHNLIDGKNKDESMVMDINANCVGTVMTLDLVNSYMKQKPQFKRALIVAADYMTIHCNEFEETSYPIFGDAGCAMIIENVEGEEGVVDSVSFANSDEYDVTQYPYCGLSSIYDDSIETYKKKMHLGDSDAEDILNTAIKSINILLEDNGLTLDDIGAFCFSQVAVYTLNEYSRRMGVPREKMIYIGDKYGYTGTSSPFIALYEGIKSNKIKRGQYVVFWSVGTYWTMDAVLLKL